MGAKVVHFRKACNKSKYNFNGCDTYICTMHNLPLPAADLIPQQVPFQCIDTLIQCNEDETRATFRVPDNHVLCFGGILSESALIEVMAQTAAASSGYHQMVTGDAVRRGFIGAVKNVKISATAKAGDEIEAVIRPLHQVGPASIVVAEVYLSAQQIASCELTIFTEN